MVGARVRVRVRVRWQRRSGKMLDLGPDLQTFDLLDT